MKFEWQKGSSDLVGILIIVIIIIVIVSDRGGTSSTYTNSSPSSSNIEAVSATNAVTVSTGNAAYSYQPYEEYITLENRSRTPVNITGWQLRNGKDKRPYYSGSTLQRFSADIAIIPQATLILSPSGKSLNQDVILQNNERAIVTTGLLGNRSPYVITSFKENMCTGYLEALPDYAFNPSLSRGCPRPQNEPGMENLDIACRKIIDNISSCETPKIGERINNEYCENCFEGKLLSSSCQAFIEEHYSYQGCLAYHQNDPKFSGNTWRLFLGRGWEMWAEEYESIELFDRFGQLVNYQSY
ncbi:MAG: hypothetical protein AAB780_00090 [Patescibacteria group bacterium]